MTDDLRDWVIIGHVRSVDPSRRKIRLKKDPSASRESLEKKFASFVIHNEIIRVKIHQLIQIGNDENEYLFELGVGTPRDTVARLKNAALVISTSDWTPNTPMRLPLENVIGFKVITTSGKNLGNICQAYRATSYDTIVIKSPTGSEKILPLTFIKKFTINWDNDEILIETADTFEPTDDN